jgi:hypothetical protein
MQPADAERLLWIFAGVLVAVDVFLFAWSRRSSARVGTVRHAARRNRQRWLAAFGLALLAGLVLAAPGETDGFERGPALLVLSAAAALVALCPASGESVYGELGVRRGWHARRFDELEEWRLMGEHLRWKLRGEWISSQVPPAEHEALRAKLVGLCPERESRFG